MKRLYVLRHAKSSWDDASLADFDRPLNERGKRAAPFMGRFMADNGLLPDVIVSSPAARARATTEAAVREMNYSGDVIYDPDVYEAAPSKLLQVLSELADDYDNAMLVGHNPGLEGLIFHLTDVHETMPTGALAVIELSTDNWAGLRRGIGRLEAFYRPRELMRHDG